MKRTWFARKCYSKKSIEMLHLPFWNTCHCLITILPKIFFTSRQGIITPKPRVIRSYKISNDRQSVKGWNGDEKSSRGIKRRLVPVSWSFNFDARIELAVFLPANILGFQVKVSKNLLSLAHVWAYPSSVFIQRPCWDGDETKTLSTIYFSISFHDRSRF